MFTSHYIDIPCCKPKINQINRYILKRVSIFVIFTFGYVLFVAHKDIVGLEVVVDIPCVMYALI